jgi:hypothetical protein
LIEYMQNFTSVSQKIWNLEEEEGVSREVLEGVGIFVYLSSTIWNIVDHYVFTNTIIMSWWVK